MGYIINGNNPLYIDKGEYYNVLTNYIPEVLVGGNADDVIDWSWVDPEQYTIGNNGVIEVRKKFSGLIPQNAPANNELMCTKIRFPNQCLMMGNPNEGELLDDVNYSIFYTQESMKSPEFAIDNPKEMQLTTFINEDYSNFADYWASKAEIPDPADLLGASLGGALEDTFLYLDNWTAHNDELIVPTQGYLYQLGGGNEGEWYFSDSWDGTPVSGGINIPNDEEYGYRDMAGKTTYQHKLMAWLDSNMHYLNDDEYDPRVVYKQIPTASQIYLKIMEKLHKIVTGDETAVWDGTNYLEPVEDWSKDDAGHIGWHLNLPYQQFQNYQAGIAGFQPAMGAAGSTTSTSPGPSMINTIGQLGQLQAGLKGY